MLSILLAGGLMAAIFYAIGYSRGKSFSDKVNETQAEQSAILWESYHKAAVDRSKIAAFQLLYDGVSDARRLAFKAAYPEVHAVLNHDVAASKSNEVTKAQIKTWIAEASRKRLDLK